ncbi:MAG: ATP-binding protein [Thauera sp.]|nr:ATP-binding protein [Thauera sp.]
MLLLDEVDSLLRDRRQARHSWEATQVNELLQQMERFGGIFIAATNLIGQLDAAAMRRFDFKLQFRALERMQRRSLFAREALGDALRVGEIAPALGARLDALDMLTQGDFANVVRQRDLLGDTPSPKDFLRRLIVECRHKEGMQAAA